MFKQVCFFRKRSDMTMDAFIDYYENMHSKLAQRLGAPRFTAECPALCAALYHATREKPHHARGNPSWL